jgi:hypothetical protein
MRQKAAGGKNDLKPRKNAVSASQPAVGRAVLALGTLVQLFGGFDSRRQSFVSYAQGAPPFSQAVVDVLPNIVDVGFPDPFFLLGR